MNDNKDRKITCHISKKEIHADDAIPGAMISRGISEIIKKKFPDWSSKNYISRDELRKYRQEYIENLIKKERGELSKLDKDVVKSMIEHESVVRNINQQYQEKLTFGQRVSDKVAEFGGSWPFIGLFATVLLIWIVINSIALMSKPFDPYPYILLNLVLSCLAAIQAPVIMMSQNRKDAKDRLRSENDYKVNLKAELEIRNLHEKIDNLTKHQWQRLLEIQEMQMEMLEEKSGKKR